MLSAVMTEANDSSGNWPGFGDAPLYHQAGDLRQSFSTASGIDFSL